MEGNEQADTLANNGRLSNPLYPARKTPRVQAAGQRAKRARQVAARSPPPQGVSPPRPIVLNFEQCIASPGPREETPDVPSDQGHESDVWLQLGLVEMPDSPRSEESTHSHLSSVPTVTNHSEGPGTPTTPFCDRITHTRGGGGAALQRPAASTDPQRPKPPHRRLTPHTTGTGIGAPRPHAVNGVFPRALCFWVVVTLGTILGFVHCDALFDMTGALCVWRWHTKVICYAIRLGSCRLLPVCTRFQEAACPMLVYISGCVLTTGCSIAVDCGQHLEHWLELPGRGHPQA